MNECKVPVFPAFFVSMLRRFAWIAPILALFVTGGGAACGGEAAPTGGAKDPGTYDQDKEPATIEEAKQRFDNARAQLERPQPATPSHVEAGQAQVDRQATQPVSPSGAGGGAAPPQAQENECTRLCRALASMQRAQVALCRMAGDEDPRCAEAKKVVEDSAQRVAHCGCR